MKFIQYTFILSILLFVSCKNANTQSVKTTEKYSYYGEEISPEGAISYDELLEKVADVDSIRDVKVKGLVSAVCQMKGCWMTIASEDEDKEEMVVSFKDYAFFMPKNLAGEVVIHGKAYREETSVDELRHYAEDEGKSAEEIAAITEPVVELKFLADGVVIERK